MLIPNASWSIFFLLLQFFLTDVGHVNLDTLDIACIGLEWAEEEHKIFGGNVHPIVITKGQSFRCLDILSFYHMFRLIIPDIIDFLLAKLVLKVTQLRWLLVIVFHPFF